MRQATATLVRPRRSSDLPACVEALAGVHEADGYPTNWPEEPADWLTGGALIGAWIAELDGRVAGHVALCRRDADDVAPGLWSERQGVPIDRTAVVSRLFVAPGARGHGLGALLLARVVAEAGASGLDPVLDVVESDTSATALYERTGWRFLGTGEQHWSPRQTVTVRCYAAPEPGPEPSPASMSAPGPGTAPGEPA
ncbi:GNAT family N-acetyltransferase [Streptomyces longisporoflavus]|uniref:GNAT family N-acetyltransferase n=1 Tax=Streptomyces longisporoflavus TaxID=28044 RepID=UPI00167DB4D0|nr:GNAT family N-acetyltransferase [Streptomyces longisporoflavus]